MTFGSSTNASFGAVSGELALVTQSGGGPWAFVADQPEGSAGGATPSKFCARAPFGTPVGRSNARVPKSDAPSWSASEAVTVAPQSVAGSTVKVKSRQTVAPPAAIAP